MNADIDELVSQVRKELDEVTLAGERVQTDTDLADTASSNFSDESLKDRLMDGTRYVVARVRSQYLEDFIIEVTPSDFEPPYDGSTPQIFRLLGSRVTADPNTFRGAVVQYAAFTCFQTLREQEEVENSKAILQRELASYRLPFRQGPPEEESE